MDAISEVANGSEQAILQVRRRIFDALHLANCIMAPISVFFSVDRIIAIGWSRHSTVVLMVTVAIVLTYLFRRWLPYPFRIAVVLAGYLLIATSSSMSSGLMSTGSLLFLAVPILAVLLLGIPAALATMVAGGILFTLSAVAVVNGWVILEYDLSTAHLHAGSWIRRGMQMLMLAVILGAAFAILDRTMIKAVERISRSERLLAHREALYRGIFAGVHDAILIHDMADGRILDANPRASELFGRTQEMLKSLTIHQLLTGAPGPHPGLAAAIAAAKEKGSQTFEWTIRAPTSLDRRPAWIEVTLHIAYVAGIQRMLVTAHDVTARKEIEQERTNFLLRERQAREHAEVANRAKDHFLAVLSHELRTPLTPVLLTLSGWQQDPSFPREHAEELGMVTEQIQLERSLINDLLDVTHVARGTLRLQPSVHDVHELIRETVQVTRTPSGPPIMLELNATRATASVDPLRLRQAIWNLLTNAQKYTPSNGRITVRTSSVGGAPDRMRIEVIDTGAGIAPDLLSRVFTPFEQGPPPSSQPGGLGLGLPIARAIVLAHGGKITAESPGLGKGATFTIELPLVDVPTTGLAQEFEVPAGPHPAGVLEAARSSDASVVAPPATEVLLVEDHEYTANALARALSGSGYRVRVAHNVAEAIRSLDTIVPDLLVSDIGLPDGSGVDIMSYVYRRRLPTKGIAITGYGMDEDVTQTKSAGFTEHLTKPITIDDLLGAMRRLTPPPAATAS